MSNKARNASVVLTTVLVVGTAAICLTVRKAQERQEFVGKPVPSGYRCRFTLSSSWQREGNVGGEYSMRPNSIQQWFERNLLHKPSSVAPTIFIKDGSVRTEDGSVHTLECPPYYWGTTKIASVQVDGHVSELTTLNQVGLHDVTLTIPIRDHSMECDIEIACDPSDISRVDQEMRAIVASFHIEKVASTGSKR